MKILICVCAKKILLGLEKPKKKKTKMFNKSKIRQTPDILYDVRRSYIDRVHGVINSVTGKPRPSVNKCRSLVRPPLPTTFVRPATFTWVHNTTQRCTLLRIFVFIYIAFTRLLDVYRGAPITTRDCNRRGRTTGTLRRT